MGLWPPPPFMTLSKNLFHCVNNPAVEICGTELYIAPDNNLAATFS